ncbi:hypothetical protein DFH08DRAFT_854434 [Mycena albidolilacea]|uniref:Uncharacterized protein n=1 Tax=Mycena albidolilacea TaxID=1033008 RepID=A0AAD7ABK3_9AGAR|nr:hypothetical protein DFH08DRAFT_854434 [Mycena albidolilacea]
MVLLVRIFYFVLSLFLAISPTLRLLRRVSARISSHFLPTFTGFLLEGSRKRTKGNHLQNTWMLGFGSSARDAVRRIHTQQPIS